LAALAAEKAAIEAAEIEARRVAEEEEARLIREKKAALEAKLSLWKEEEARAAEAAAKAKSRKRRAADGVPLGEDDSDSEDFPPPAPAAVEEPDADADAALFGSDASDNDEPAGSFAQSETGDEANGETETAGGGGRLKRANAGLAPSANEDETMRDIFDDGKDDGGDRADEGEGALRKKRRVLDDDDDDE